MIEIVELLTDDGASPFGRWFGKLDARAALKVRTALARLEAGNVSQVKGVGAGVFECRIAYGPGYRVYFGKDGERVVVLLGGGTKKRQQSDIETAHGLWKHYKRRKRQER